MVLISLLTLAFTPPSIESKVESAFAQLSLDDELSLIGGYKGFNIQPIPKIGLPEILMSDGPVGVRNFGPTTAYPAGVCLAATWNPKLALQFGTGIGRDARARGVGIWLGPGVNLARIVQNGRNFEYLGEDPWLSSRMAVGIINGVQSQGVVATVKHYAANNHENDRNVDSSDVDERTMRELYLRPFEAAVKEAHVGAVMCAYNKLNGMYCAENYWLLNQVLKNDWKFDGLVMSDWGAVHSTLGTAKNGLDLEMPSGDFMNPKTLSAAVADGTVPKKLIDDKVRRILRVIYTHHLDETRNPADWPKNDSRNAVAALKVAEEGTVLLKNNGLLPLSSKRVKKLLVIGPNATVPVTGGGGSSFTNPLHQESLVSALKSAFPNLETFATSPDEAGFTCDARVAGTSEKGFMAEYFDNLDLSEPSVAKGVEPEINHEWDENRPGPAGYRNFSTRWTATFTATVGGIYQAVTQSDDGIRVFVDDKPVIDQWSDHGTQTDVGYVTLNAGQTVALRIEYYQKGGGAIARFGFARATGALESETNRAAVQAADAIVLGVGFGPSKESEGEDRPFDLPTPQQKLIDDVIALNPHVVLVNNSGAGVNLSRWSGKASAIVQAWYGGQEGAKAVAEILVGTINPSGKLPTSFPSELANSYYGSAYPPIDHHLDYREKLLVGYRWFDAHSTQPLYPFGFGLSYTSFKVRPVRANSDQNNLTVIARVKNTGHRTGAETIQLYVGQLNRRSGDPVKELKAFRKVWVRPGAAEKVALTIPISSIAHWDTGLHRWRVAAGKYLAYVGNSSQNVTALRFVVSKTLTYKP